MGRPELRRVTPISNSLWQFGKRTMLMGILNTTPDSFSDGGAFTAVDSAAGHANAMLEAGADIIDIGGQSTRPGADRVPPELEAERVVPVIK